MRGGLDYGLDTCWYNPAGKTTELPVTYEIENLEALKTILALK
jgi:2-haloacid dehalogenase